MTHFDESSRWMGWSKNVLVWGVGFVSRACLLVRAGSVFDFNKRTGSRLISHIFVDYEWVGTFEFGKRNDLNKRTGRC
jgi:hypothetical protein